MHILGSYFMDYYCFVREITLDAIIMSRDQSMCDHSVRSRSIDHA